MIHDNQEEDFKMADDFLVSYLGTTTRVSQMLFKPGRASLLRVYYTFYLPTRSVTIWQLQDRNEELHWVEFPFTKSSFAEELGALIEQYYVDEEQT